MELRKSRFGPLSGLFLLVISPLFCGLGQAKSSLLAMVLGTGTLLAGAVVLVRGLRPFRVHIGADGLTIKHKEIDRLVRWDELTAVIIDQPPPTPGAKVSSVPQLLLVPAAGAGSDLPATDRDPVGDRPCLTLLDFHDVRDSPDLVADALARFAGDRFTDARRLRQERFGVPDFMVVLRGYDVDQVDQLVSQGQQALAFGGTLQRMTARVAIDSASLTVAMRGYDREQVDAVLSALSTELAKEPAS